MDDSSPFLEIPHADWVASNRSAFAIADSLPVSPGHSLVVPRRLISTWWEASDDERADMWTLVDEVKAILDMRRQPDGYNVGFNSGRAAGQTVDHLHIHVIPRYNGDVPDPRGGLRHLIDARNDLQTVDETNGLEGIDLFDGVDDRFLKLELIRSLINTSYDRIDLIVSFIMRSGVAIIQERLADALDRGVRIRILTTDYLQVTEHAALAHLLDLEDDYPDALETRVFHDPATSFHPKAYLFWSSESSTASAFVGSSNLSASGIGSGVEWNVGLRDVQPLVERFDRLWLDSRAIRLTRAWLLHYEERPRPRVAGVEVIDAIDVPPEPALEPATPREIQKAALTALEQTRLDGHRAGLVVLATGLGKTWLAAFDTARPQYRRVLFVAHREEILRQSRDVFRRVQPDADLGLFNADEKEPDARIVFASIQTIANRLREFEPERFDYIVVDEFHHAAAPSYRRVIDYFRPQFLLGLTATPQRMDGADLLALCHDNLVFECSLVEGIERGELVPFTYWGIRDIVDFAPIPWRNGRFDPEALATAVETQDRAEQAFREWAAHKATRTLAFCCSVTHADFMQHFFNERGVRCAAVHSAPSSAPRRAAIQQLRDGDLDVLFSVDVFNEGIDVPEIDTVLMLRPTDSPIVFLQQLGRGLRPSDAKTELRVIDFIGNHRSFLMRPRTLLSLGSGSIPSNQRLLEAIESGAFGLPAGCSVDYELSLVELFEELAKLRGRSVIEEYCRAYFEDEGVRPSAAQVFAAGYNPGSMRARFGSWFSFLASLDLLNDDEQRVLARYEAPLATFESESITKSYKLVALRAMLRENTLRAGTSVPSIAATSLDLIKADPRLVSDTSNRELGDLNEVNLETWTRFWRTWPLSHLAGEDSTRVAQFRFADHEGADWFEPRFTVEAEDGETFDEMVSELVEYRLQRYLLASQESPEGAYLLKLNHSGGKPILMLDRRRCPNLPEGDAEFLADGIVYVGRFVKVALNVAQRPGEDSNQLAGLLRGWFGPSAGLPGTSQSVALEVVDNRWVMRPVGVAANATDDGTVVPLFPSYAVACGAFDAVDPQARRSGYLQLSAGAPVDRVRQFVAFARGDSMDGGSDPVQHGDPLLFEWIRGVGRSSLVGERVIVEQQEGAEMTAALKRLDRDGEAYSLRSDNPAFQAILGTTSMRIIARLARRLEQSEVNRFASRIGVRLNRRSIAEMFGSDFNPGFQQTGYASVGSDAVLLATLSKTNMEIGRDYVDAFESPTTFTWSSQSTTSPDSKRGREVLDALETGMQLHLWVREDSTAREFEYCGLVAPITHEGSRPIQVRFRLLTPLTAEAWARFQGH
jgi:superfamily II DNA or RNA helicase/diadenosine tetraphosphate (Ap4A) HIT family hydrolase/HKD family nuclease